MVDAGTMATAFKFFEFGRHAFTGGGPQEALACYSLAIQHLPAGMPALASQLLRSRSDCWWELGNFDEAFADMEEAMKYDPNCEISFSAESTPHVSAGLDKSCMQWLNKGGSGGGGGAFNGFGQTPFFCLKFTLNAWEMVSLTFQIFTFSWRKIPPGPP